MDKVKNHGKIYTPENIIYMMLDFAGYNKSENIIEKHVIDNSCGDGNFLYCIVIRYIHAYLSLNKTTSGLEQHLEKYIHGMEIDGDEVNKCISRLNAIIDTYHLNQVSWDIKQGDSLLNTDYDQKMDYVFGNPPYVRTKNVTNELKYEFRNFSFSQSGMSDLYLTFYEIGFRMLNENGKLCYITPSQWINSSSGSSMRKYIFEKKNLKSVIDFEHSQLFNGAQTYVMITLFDKEEHDCVEYNVFSEGSIVKIDDNKYNECFIKGDFVFGKNKVIESLKLIKECTKSDSVRVKNGYATLADDVFIKNLPNNLDGYIIDVVKSSTGKYSKCLFPYDGKYNIVCLDEIQENAPKTYEYIMQNEARLKTRTYEKQEGGIWYALGRSQGICDTNKRKIAINTLLRTKEDIKISEVNEGVGVYGGIYILTDKSVDIIKNILITDLFVDYVKSLRKYKSGGYYTFNTKDLENYLNYYIS